MNTDTLSGKNLPVTLRLCLRALMLAVVAVTCGVVVGGANAATPNKTPGKVQMMCPVMPDEKIDPDISLEYEGQTVYFCCQKCRRNFETSPQRYASAIVTTSGPVDHHASGEAGAGTQPSNDHDHSGDHGQARGSTQEDVWSKIGRFHPMAVHFPIALLISAALARCLMLLGSTWAGQAVRFCVWLGGVSAVIAAALGWLNAGWPGGDESFGDVIFNHRWLGVSAAVFGVVLIVMIEVEANRPTKALSNLTTLGLLVGAGLVGATGHFGGIMVFGPDYLPW